MRRLPFTFYLQIGICASLWGSAFPVIKNSFETLGLESYGEQLIFAGSRFVLAGLFVFPFCRRRISSLLSAPRWKLLAVILGQTYFQYLFFYYGLSISTGTLGALLVCTGSFWWILLGPIILKTSKPKRIHWILLFCCSLGIVIAVYQPGATEKNLLLGALAFLGATLASAIGAIFMKEVAPISGSRVTTAFSLFLGGCLLLFTAIPQWADYGSHFSLTTLWVTLYLALLSAIAFTLWNRLIECYSINVLSAYRFLIPLMGVIESVLFIPGEVIRPGLVVGGVIVLSCLMVISTVGDE